LSGAGAKKPKPVRRLWGSGKGKYTTKGKYASATVRGTQWLVSDYCDHTVVTVKTGSVIVHNAVTGKNVIVKAGRSYVATR
jgi:ferric-dicitrate binding protein FerR (iron transport regulator)